MCALFHALWTYLQKMGYFLEQLGQWTVMSYHPWVNFQSKYGVRSLQPGFVVRGAESTKSTRLHGFFLYFFSFAKENKNKVLTRGTRTSTWQSKQLKKHCELRWQQHHHLALRRALPYMAKSIGGNAAYQGLRPWQKPLQRLRTGNSKCKMVQRLGLVSVSCWCCIFIFWKWVRGWGDLYVYTAGCDSCTSRCKNNVNVPEVPSAAAVQESLPGKAWCLNT